MTILKTKDRHPASFRDPSGFLFTRAGVLYRQVNQRYAEEYKRLMDSGLYESLSKVGRLVSHQEVDIKPAQKENTFKIIQPEKLPFISYPYEWSFSQLKSAALTTLSIQKRSLDVGMSLKDASAYNIQFHQTNTHNDPSITPTPTFRAHTFSVIVHVQVSTTLHFHPSLLQSNPLPNSTYHIYKNDNSVCKLQPITSRTPLHTFD